MARRSRWIMARHPESVSRPLLHALDHLVGEHASPTLTAFFGKRFSKNRFLIAGWQMIWPQSTGKAQMKTILTLIVGLMLAGCGSMENHVRNRDAVDAICACP